MLGIMVLRFTSVRSWVRVPSRPFRSFDGLMALSVRVTMTRSRSDLQNRINYSLMVNF